MPDVELMQRSPELADRVQALVRQTRALREDERSNARSGRDDGVYGLIGEEEASGEVEDPQVIEGPHPRRRWERKRCRCDLREFQLGLLRLVSLLIPSLLRRVRLRRRLDPEAQGRVPLTDASMSGAQEGERLVLDFDAGVEAQLAQVRRVEPDLADASRGDERGVDEVHFEESWAVTSERDEGEVGEEGEANQLDLRDVQRVVSS